MLYSGKVFMYAISFLHQCVNDFYKFDIALGELLEERINEFSEWVRA